MNPFNRFPKSFHFAGVIALAFAAPSFGDETKASVEAGPHAAHAADAAAVKAPLAEVMHCPLAFAGVHLLKEDPSRFKVAYHFCKPLNAEVNQCILYDSTSPNARLIGIEYLVTDEIYRTMSEEEQAFWHDHKYEIDAGLLKSLVQKGEEEQATMKVVRTLWGKVFHTWVEGDRYPMGSAKLFWSVTGTKPFVLSDETKLPKEIEEARAKAKLDKGASGE